MVRATVNDVVVAESSDTAFVEGNHYFPPESIKVVLSISDTTVFSFHFSGVVIALSLSRHASYYNADSRRKDCEGHRLVRLFSYRCLLAFLPVHAFRVYPEPTSKFEIKGRYAFDKAQVQVA
ncbi:hypothetical protein H4582DRAFT_2054325 [Lactarius indigo]|nr:hypothetical protein H4582DRAFT_2054325 [Lactarius indigo]